MITEISQDREMRVELAKHKKSKAKQIKVMIDSVLLEIKMNTSKSTDISVQKNADFVREISACGCICLQNCLYAHIAVNYFRRQFYRGSNKAVRRLAKDGYVDIGCSDARKEQWSSCNTLPRCVHLSEQHCIAHIEPHDYDMRRLRGVYDFSATLYK